MLEINPVNCHSENQQRQVTDKESSRGFQLKLIMPQIVDCIEGHFILLEGTLKFDKSKIDFYSLLQGTCSHCGPFLLTNLFLHRFRKMFSSECSSFSFYRLQRQHCQCFAHFFLRSQSTIFYSTRSKVCPHAAICLQQVKISKEKNTRWRNRWKRMKKFENHLRWIKVTNEE